MRGALRALCATLWTAGLLCAPLDGEETGKPASEDEVNVLMYGVLQFSEVLHNAYQNTEGKLARIANALRRHEGTLQRLEQEASLAAVTEEQIRQALTKLQSQTDGLNIQTVQLQAALAKAEREEDELHNQVTGLEENLKAFHPRGIGTLKDLTHQNSSVLKILMKWKQEHRRSLEQQEQQLVQLQRRVNTSL